MLPRTPILLLILVLAGGCSSREPVAPPAEKPTAVENAGDGQSAKQAPPEEKVSPSFPNVEKKADPPPTVDVKLTAEMKQTIARLVNADRKVQDQAQVELEGWQDKAVDTLLAAAKDADADVRAGATFGLLGRFNGFDPRLTAALIQALGDKNARVRGIALSAASQIPPAELEPAISNLAAILANSKESANARAQAAALLATLSQAAFEPLKHALLADTDRRVRLACLEGVVKTASSPEQGVNVLIAVLSESEDAIIRRRAATALGDLGAQAAPAAAALALALGDADPRVGAASAGALVNLGGAAVPLLSEKVLVGEKTTQLLAIDALQKLGPAAAVAGANLKQAAQDSDPEISAAAQAALKAIAGM